MSFFYAVIEYRLSLNFLSLNAGVGDEKVKDYLSQKNLA